MHGRKPYSFAESQAQLANTAIWNAAAVGEALFQGVQGMAPLLLSHMYSSRYSLAELILGTYYWASAK